MYILCVRINTHTHTYIYTDIKRLIVSNKDHTSTHRGFGKQQEPNLFSSIQSAWKALFQHYS